MHAKFEVRIFSHFGGHTKRRRDDGTTGQDDGTIIRSKWTIADDDGTVWAVVDDGQ